jgi:hypothetical protein
MTFSLPFLSFRNASMQERAAHAVHPLTLIEMKSDKYAVHALTIEEG